MLRLVIINEKKEVRVQMFRCLIMLCKKHEGDVVYHVTKIFNSTDFFACISLLSLTKKFFKDLLESRWAQKDREFIRLDKMENLYYELYEKDKIVSQGIYNTMFLVGLKLVPDNNDDVEIIPYRESVGNTDMRGLTFSFAIVDTILKKHQSGEAETMKLTETSTKCSAELNADDVDLEDV